MATIQPRLSTFRQQDQVERKTPEVIFVPVSWTYREMELFLPNNSLSLSLLFIFLLIHYE